MVGYGEMTEVMLWVQTTGPCTIQYRYVPASDTKASRLTAVQRAVADSDYIVHTLMTGLPEGTQFTYELLIDGTQVSRPYPLRFQTQPLWQWRKDPPAFSVAFGSCAYINDPPADRPGTPYGSNYEIFTALAGTHPDVMLWLGDNTYYREIDWNAVSGMRARYAHTRALPELQPLLGATHNYAIWDDHDYGQNDADRTYFLKDASLDVFRLFWANHTYGTPGLDGVFGRMTWGDAEFFLLDDRYYRSPNDAPDDAEKTMFGKAQLRWLIESLASSNATFRIVVGGNQILNPMHPYEALSAFTTEYNDLIRSVKGWKIPGLVFLSGDRHMSELIRLEDPAFYPLYDYTSSSLTAGLSRPRSDSVNVARVPGTLVDDAHTFGLLKFSGPRKDRVLTMECYDHTGKLRWTHVVRASDLRPPK